MACAAGQRSLHVRIVRIDEHGHARGCGDQLAQHFQPFCRHLGIEKIDTSQVGPRPRETGDKAELNRVFADGKNNRNRGGRCFARERGMGASARNNHCDRSANQFGRQHWQPIELAFAPAIFDRHVLPFDIASLLKASSERAQTLCSGF